MNDKYLRVLCVLHVLGHPRDSKRITMLQQASFLVEAAYFDRDYHAGRLPTCQVTCLGKISHGNYFQRILKFIYTLPLLRQV